ncbi:MAG TPA: hypothetical protein VIH42_13010 [Thermoguttaceae bacterium]
MGWLLSLPYNYWALGTAFTASGEWNNLPLWMATSPTLKIADVLYSKNQVLQDHPYALVVLYTLICLVVYSLIGLVVGFIVQTCLLALKHKRKTE